MLCINRICPLKKHRLKFSKEVITIGHWPQKIFDLITWETFAFSNVAPSVTEQEIKIQYARTVCILIALTRLVCKSSPAAHSEHAGLHICRICSLTYTLAPICIPGHIAAEQSFCPYSIMESEFRLCWKALWYKSSNCTRPFRLSDLIPDM